MLIKSNYSLFTIALFCLAFLVMGFSRVYLDLEELMKESQAILNAAYAKDMADKPSKKVDIQLTKDGFFRFRKTLANGKQEYFSFNFSQFEDISFLGNTSSGILVIKTMPESIIVQTFYDRTGNIDSMASELKLPMKNLEPNEVQQFQDCFLQIRQKLKQP